MSGSPSRAAKTALLLALAAAVAPAAAQPLPAGIADARAVSVSGLSSGAFMAVQLHVAHSRTFSRGVGVIAGGPYDCAEGQLVNAYQGRCMTRRQPVPVAALLRITQRWAQQGLIDPTEALANTRVFLFSGANDRTVAPAVVDDAQAYYRGLAPAASFDFQRHPSAGHAMVTDDYGRACGASTEPYIEKCDTDGDVAGRLLRHLHGPLQPRAAGALSARPARFDQAPFAGGSSAGPAERGLGAAGWAFVPAACAAAGAGCRLHVALHGCHQNAGQIDQQFVERAGYNRWADTNRIVVLYPQTGASATNGCWDWWGYGRADFARRSGPQVAAIKAMVDRLTGTATPAPPPVDARCSVATPFVHWLAGRAAPGVLQLLALGSGEPIGAGWSTQAVPLQRVATAQYVIGDCR